MIEHIFILRHIFAYFYIFNLRNFLLTFSFVKCKRYDGFRVISAQIERVSSSESRCPDVPAGKKQPRAVACPFPTLLALNVSSSVSQPQAKATTAGAPAMKEAGVGERKVLIGENKI